MLEHLGYRRQVGFVVAHDPEPLAREVAEVVDLARLRTCEDQRLVAQDRNRAAVVRQQHVRAHDGKIRPRGLKRFGALPYVVEWQDAEAHVALLIDERLGEGPHQPLLDPAARPDRDRQGRRRDEIPVAEREDAGQDRKPERCAEEDPVLADAEETPHGLRSFQARRSRGRSQAKLTSLAIVARQFVAAEGERPGNGQKASEKRVKLGTLAKLKTP